MPKMTASQLEEMSFGNNGMPRVGSTLSILSLKSTRRTNHTSQHRSNRLQQQITDDSETLSIRRGISSYQNDSSTPHDDVHDTTQPHGLMSSSSNYTHTHMSVRSHQTHKSIIKSLEYNDEVNEGKEIPQTCLQRFRYGFFSNSLILFLMVAIILVSAIDWIMWKKTLNRFHSPITGASYTFFVLQLYIFLMLCLASISTFICIYVLKIIDDKQRKFPQRIFMAQSSFDACTQLLSSTSSPVVAGHIQTLLNQGMLPLIMLFSFFLLKTRYNIGQYTGAALILGGTLLAAIPAVLHQSADASGRETKAYGVILYSLSSIPFAFGNTYSEYIFRKTGVRSHDEKSPEDPNTNNAQPNQTDEKTQMIPQNYQDSNCKLTDTMSGQYGTLEENSSSTLHVNQPTPDYHNETSFFQTSPSINQHPLQHTVETSSTNDKNDTTRLYSSSSQTPTPQIHQEENPQQQQQQEQEPLPQLNIFYLMFWTSFYQLIFTILLFPLLNLPIFGGVPFRDIPQQFVNGATCLVGKHVDDLDCETGMIPGVSLLIYVLLNWLVSLLRINLVRYGSALMLQITNALALLFSNVLFSFEFIMGDQTEKFNIFDIFGLCLVMIGFLAFRLSLLYHDRFSADAKAAAAALAAENDQKDEHFDENLDDLGHHDDHDLETGSQYHPNQPSSQRNDQNALNSNTTPQIAQPYTHKNSHLFLSSQQSYDNNTISTNDKYRPKPHIELSSSSVSQIKRR